MRTTYNILIPGASYGSLLATTLLLAKRWVKLACLPAEAAMINGEGTRVRFPIKGHEALVEIDSRQLPGELSADVPGAVDPTVRSGGADRAGNRSRRLGSERHRVLAKP